MKVYLDNCVYNRPFDDLASQPRMFFEAFAFYIILKLAEQDKIHIVTSDALIYENEKISDPLRKGRISILFDLSKSRILFDEDIVLRRKVRGSGLEILHLVIKLSTLMESKWAEVSDYTSFKTLFKNPTVF